MGRPVGVGDAVVLQRQDLQGLFDALRARGYRVVGPTVRDGAMTYDELTSAEELPIGWTDAQDGGTYRLAKRADQAVFGYAVGPHSWKKLLHPPALRLWRATHGDNGFQIIPEDENPPPTAFLGVRACDLRAIAVQDAVFLRGPHVDPHYKARRGRVFLVAVNCSHPGGTCFCASVNAGPKVTLPCDLALTEVLEASRHYFVVEVGSEPGARILRDVPRAGAGEAERAAADRVVAEAGKAMGRTLDTSDIGSLFQRNADHPRWHDVAARCLTCGNCTMVCPTCFCTTVEDVTDLTGDHAERWRKWDSCFTLDFSYIHGGSIRATAKARYRQWMTHKLATWIDQFGTSGCVGCGRCITWCPVGIDITAEVRAIRAAEPSAPASGSGRDDGNA